MNLVEESKVLIMNEANQRPFLLNHLSATKSETKHQFFRHEKISFEDTRVLNVIEFSQVLILNLIFRLSFIE